jgi:hypothetical protein
VTLEYPEHHKFLATPDADHLAELYLLRADLVAANNALTLYLEKFEFSHSLTAEGRIISASLFRDSILLFCSCFSTKERKRLNPTAVYGRVDDWEPFYRRLHDTRDAFVAHNFGPQRQHHIVVICLEVDGKLQPGGFTEVYMRFGGWIADETKRLLSFIDIARNNLEERIGAAEQVVLKMLEAVSSEELSALQNAELSLPETSDIRLSRARFKASGRGERRPLPPRRWGQAILDEFGTRPVDSGED